MNLSRIEFLVRLSCVFIVAINVFLNIRIFVLVLFFYISLTWVSGFRGLEYRGFPVERVSFIVVSFFLVLAKFASFSGSVQYPSWAGIMILPVFFPFFGLWVISFFISLYNVLPWRRVDMIQGHDGKRDINRKPAKRP